MFIPKPEHRLSEMFFSISTEIILYRDYQMGDTNQLSGFIRELLSKGELMDMKYRERRNANKEYC